MRACVRVATDVGRGLSLRFERRFGCRRLGFVRTGKIGASGKGGPEGAVLFTNGAPTPLPGPVVDILGRIFLKIHYVRLTCSAHQLASGLVPGLLAGSRVRGRKGGMREPHVLLTAPRVATGDRPGCVKE